MKRRDFLVNSTLAASGFLISGQSVANPLVLANSRKVIVLGAGLSGLYSALLLKEKGYEVTILEARNRIGGRVFTHSMDKEQNLTMELGAEWVGDSHSRIIGLCKRFNLTLNDHRFNSHLYVSGQYKRPGEWSYSSAGTNTMKDLLEKFKVLEEKEHRKLDKTDWWRYLINKGFSNEDLEIRELFDSTDFGETIRNVSAYCALSEYAYSSAHNEMDMHIAGGNAALASSLAKEFGNEKIFTSSKVKTITRKGSEFEVICQDGKSYQAAKIICTLPTTSIQSIQWEPDFTTEKKEALQELQYARIMKNASLFSERFWKNEDFDMITDRPSHYFYHSTQNQPGTKGILTSYATGDKCYIMSKLKAEQRQEEIALSLEPLTKKAIPEKTQAYDWSTDPYSRGAYAIYDTRQWFGLREALEKPHADVYFAGEHLSVDWQGFMEGALQSGEDVVKKYF